MNAVFIYQSTLIPRLQLTRLMRADNLAEAPIS